MALNIQNTSTPPQQQRNQHMLATQTDDDDDYCNATTVEVVNRSRTSVLNMPPPSNSSLHRIQDQKISIRRPGVIVPTPTNLTSTQQFHPKAQQGSHSPSPSPSSPSPPPVPATQPPPIPTSPSPNVSSMFPQPPQLHTQQAVETKPQTQTIRQSILQQIKATEQNDDDDDDDYGYPNGYGRSCITTNVNNNNNTGNYGQQAYTANTSQPQVQPQAPQTEMNFPPPSPLRQQMLNEIHQFTPIPQQNQDLDYSQMDFNQQMEYDQQQMMEFIQQQMESTQTHQSNYDQQMMDYGEITYVQQEQEQQQQIQQQQQQQMQSQQIQQQQQIQSQQMDYNSNQPQQVNHNRFSIQIQLNPQLLSAFQRETYMKLQGYASRALMTFEESLTITKISEDFVQLILNSVLCVMDLTPDNIRMFSDLIASYRAKNCVPIRPELLKGILTVLEKVVSANSTSFSSNQLCSVFVFDLLDVLGAVFGFRGLQIRHTKNIARNAVSSDLLKPNTLGIFLPTMRDACRYFVDGWTKYSGIRTVKRLAKRAIFLRGLSRRCGCLRDGSPTKKMAAAFRYLIRDERSLVKKLSIVNDIYRNHLFGVSTKFITEDEVKIIFSPVATVFAAQRGILDALEMIAGSWPIVSGVPNIIVSNASHFESYSSYVLNICFAEKTLTQLRVKNKAFASFIEKQMKESYNDLDISALIIAPLNHINVYEKYLRSLSLLIDETHPDYAPMEQAILIIESTKWAVQLAMQQSGDRYVAMDAIYRMGGLTGGISDNPDRRLVMEFDASVTYPKKTRTRHVVLFTDILLIAKIKDNTSGTAKEILPINSISLTTFTSEKYSHYIQIESDSIERIAIKIKSESEYTNILSELKFRVKNVFSSECFVKVSSEPSTAASASSSSSSKAAPQRSKDSIFGKSFLGLTELEGRKAIGVPLIVETMCNFLVGHLEVEGLFRLSGGFDEINALVQHIDRDPDRSIPDSTNPLVAASVFKMFFMESAEPLVMYNLYSEFVRVAGDVTDENIVDVVEPIFRRFPFEHIQTYLYLVDFLKITADYSFANKMDSRNLAIVFTPSLFRTRTIDDTGITDIQHLSKLLKMLIDRHQDIKNRLNIRQNLYFTTGQETDEYYC